MKVEAYIHSLKGHEHDRHVLGEAEIIRRIDDNLYLAEVNGARCTAVFNPFVGRYFVDDVYRLHLKAPMRRLTGEDLVNIVGRTIKSYRVEAAKVKQGSFINSSHYGIILGKNSKDQYVTWQFHLLNDESVSVYWGHYITDREEALRDYHTRGENSRQKFHVMVTETFQLTIAIEADNKEQAEQMVSADWQKREFTLGPECFAGVEFEVVPAVNDSDDSL